MILWGNHALTRRDMYSLASHHGSETGPRIKGAPPSTKQLPTTDFYFGIEQANRKISANLEVLPMEEPPTSAGKTEQKG